MKESEKWLALCDPYCQFRRHFPNCVCCDIALEYRRFDPRGARRPVVLCRDCIHSAPRYADRSRCFLWRESGIDVFNDGFCIYGKKREEN